MHQYLLIDISTSKEVPLLNISNVVNTESSAKAALIFVSRAFAGNKNTLTAKVRIQTNTGVVRTFTVHRSEMISKNGTIKYKHFIV